MSKPQLQRQITQSGPTAGTTWLSDLFLNVCDSWANAKRCFPEFFRGDIAFKTLLVSDDLMYKIGLHNGVMPDLSVYRENEFVGIALRHKMDGQPERIGDNLYTPMSFESPGIAMGEICLMAREGIRGMIRHILYSTGYLDRHQNIEEFVDHILNYGNIPNDPDDLDNDHVRVSSPHPVR